MPIDIARQLGAQTREVLERTREGTSVKVVVMTRTFRTGADDLWDALTNPERIPRWFMRVTGELRAGGRYQLQGNAGGEVLHCDPPRHFEATWEHGGNVSWIEAWLEPAGDGATLLRFEHTAHVPEDWWHQYGPGATGVGWDMGLLGLDLHVTTGEAVAETMGVAWALSDEGKQFARGCSAAWRDASVRFGTDPAGAQEAAARTTAFYTGESQ